VLKLTRTDAGLIPSDFSNFFQSKTISLHAVEMDPLCLVKGLSAYPKTLADLFC